MRTLARQAAGWALVALVSYIALEGFARAWDAEAESHPIHAAQKKGR